MSTTDVIRPISTRFTGAGTAVPSGTLSSVTSDNSDTTYVNFPVGSYGNNWSTRLAAHTPAAGYGRHRIRGRVRIAVNAGNASESLNYGRGTNDWIDNLSIPVTAAMTEQVSNWSQDSGYGLATVGALSDLNIGGGWPLGASGGATALHTAECYIDIDCRLRPDYTPEVRDAAGVNQAGGTVTDTNQPVLFFGSVAYDGLSSRDWSVAITDGVGTVVFTASGSGTAPVSVPTTTGLDDGSYTATFTARSTIRVSDPFEHVQALTFAVENTVPSSSPPLLTVVRQDDGYLVTWEDPGGQPWDDNYVVAELWRDDCNGSQRIATVPDGLNGSYLDLAIPQLDPQLVDEDGVCTTEAEPCDITYRVRYWGFQSTFVELPSTIPADMILGWPDTAASIPSGWTRVTALDGFYPRGATAVTAPTATGGAATHTHTLNNHLHVIGSHDHSLGGSTGTSNSSTTSARFNGASRAQADQPHSHTRPGSTGTAGSGNSSATAPGMTAAANVPLTREVIWIKSAGTQPNYPTGCLAWATEAVSGWDTDTGSSARFLRGAAAAGNGGAANGNAEHNHTVNAHTHNGFSHDHSIGSTSLSNPVSSQEAGDGSSTPRWLPRHTHPMDVVAASTGNSTSVSGGVTNNVSNDPPNRRLRVLRNTGGGTQTRIIGLFTGAISALDPLLTWCNGGGGTPDMRTWFARDTGSDSINSTGGAAAHTHTTPSHTHDIGNHSHDTNVGTSNTGSLEAPSFGDLGDSPTTGHTHSSGSTSNASPSVAGAGSGTALSAANLPVYHEVHFVRLDGTISGGPLPVPALKVTDFAVATVPAFTYTDQLDRLATLDGQQMAVPTDRAHSFPRLVADSTPLDGGVHSVSTALGGEDATLSVAVVGKQAIDQLEDILMADRVYWSPVGGTAGWFAPQGWTVKRGTTDVKVVQISMTRQPWPSTPEPSEFL